MLQYLGYFGALFIGLILGITGGGGSILTVPILVYLLNFSPVIATAYSLFIVGTTSAFGTIQNFRKGIVEVKTAFLFAIPSFIAVFATRKFIVPAIPEVLFQSTNITITKDLFLMVLFAVIMFAAAIPMLQKKTNAEPEISSKPVLIVSILKIMAVGILIGLVGAGGGFLIIPALLFMARLPMRKAIGTSLLIIAINSLIGFTGDIGHFTIDWYFLLKFTSLAIAGIFIGIYCSRFVNEDKLKKAFGWFVLLMALFIFAREVFL